MADLLNSSDRARRQANNQTSNSIIASRGYNALTKTNSNSAFGQYVTTPSLNKFDDKIINPVNLQRIIKEKLAKYKLCTYSDIEVNNALNNGLELYLRNIIEKLIKISRIRNTSFEQFSKYKEKADNVRNNIINI
jgi:hypothetical protein